VQARKCTQMTGNQTFKTSDRCEIAYTVHPAPGKPRLALIHSLALDRSVWDGVIKELTGKAEVLAYDCRGHGRSGRKGGPYTCELFARDLAQLLDHIGWRDAVVAGCSMGGCIAQAFTALHAQRAQGACLIDTTAWYGPEAPKQWRERAATGRNKGLAALIDFQVTRWFSDGFRASRPDAVEPLKQIFLANDVDCYEATCEMLGTADLRPLLPSIKAPVAIVVGDEDYATTVDMARALNRALPQSTLTVLEGARHITPVERPQDIAKQIAGLLR
jgi:3-oxoadipate enol-lactonase